MIKLAILLLIYVLVVWFANAPCCLAASARASYSFATLSNAALISSFKSAS
jgi:hypothetical protein